MYKFSKSQSFQKLTELAKNPYDLTAEDALSPKRIADYVSKSCNYRLFYDAERVTDEVIDALKELVENAIDAGAKHHSGA